MPALAPPAMGVWVKVRRKVWNPLYTISAIGRQWLASAWWGGLRAAPRSSDAEEGAPKPFFEGGERVRRKGALEPAEVEPLMDQGDSPLPGSNLEGARNHPPQQRDDFSEGAAVPAGEVQD